MRSLPNTGGVPARRTAKSVLRNSMVIEHIAVSELKSHPRSPRITKPLDERTAAKVMDVREFEQPLVIDGNNTVLVGDIFYRAAKRLGRETLPVIRIEHLSETEALEMLVAYQRLNELGEWDRQQLAIVNLEFEIELPGYEPEHIGFEVGTMDLIVGEQAEEPEEEPVDEFSSNIAVSEVGDVWRLGKHRIVCGDSTDAATFVKLMAGVSHAALVFTDPPFGWVLSG